MPEILDQKQTYLVFRTTIQNPDHSTTGHVWTIHIPDLSCIQMVTVFPNRSGCLTLQSYLNFSIMVKIKYGDLISKEIQNHFFDEKETRIEYRQSKYESWKRERERERGRERERERESVCLWCVREKIE